MHSYQSISAALEKEKKARENSIERLVCSGGGAKGIVYSGCYQALETTGLLEQIHEISGASAGSIAAALIAVGMSPINFHNLSLKTNFSELMGHRIGFIIGKNKEGVCCLTKDGKPLEDFIREQIIKSVKTTIEHLVNFQSIASQHDDLKECFAKFQTENPTFTFRDLSILRRFFPNEFKRLIIPAVKFPSGEIQIFNAELTPDVEIALACRASASLPVFMEPVQIEFAGKKQKFVDGGFLDNLPTDYFDMDETRIFSKNQKPEQTIVLAFGDGLDNKKNPVFQALYGPRWDDLINSELLEKIILDGIKLARQSLGKKATTHSDESDQLIHSINFILKREVTLRNIPTELYQIVAPAMEKTINSLLLTPDSHMQFWRLYRSEKSEIARACLLASLVIDEMKPPLSHAGKFERYQCNVLSSVLGDLKVSYKHTEKFEDGYQKLRTEYPLRTIELRVGKIQTRDFNAALKSARIMDAFGYLDTINHITNYELSDPNTFSPEHFYVSLMDCFEQIYQAVLYGAGKDPMLDTLSQEIAQLKKHLETLDKKTTIVSRQLYQLIKDRAEAQLDSIAAFALSRAVEFQNQILSADDLFKETYEEGFKRSRVLSLSSITGERFFKSETLHNSLKDRSMFDLYRRKTGSTHTSRTDKVFDTLQRIESFHDAYALGAVKRG